MSLCCEKVNAMSLFVDGAAKSHFVVVGLMSGHFVLQGLMLGNNLWVEILVTLLY